MREVVVMIRKVTGIIVSTVDYKESSKIINIFTENDGVIGVLSKGCRNIKSKLHQASNSLIKGNFYLRQYGTGLPILTEVDIECYYKEIKMDIIKQSYALYLLELSVQVWRHSNQKNIYDLLLMALEKIENNYDDVVITYILELKLLKYLGIEPELSCCVSCRKKTDIVTVSSYRGGYLCRDCLKNENVYSLKMVQLIRIFSMVDLASISSISVSEEVKREIGLFIDDYYERYSGLYLKSKDFLKKFSSSIS